MAFVTDVSVQKELIMLGVLASRGLQYGVAAHMRRAITPGATKEEWFEAIKTAAVPGGGVAYSVGVRALQALEQDGVFAPAPPSAPARRQRGTATPPPSTPAPATRQRGKRLRGEERASLRQASAEVRELRALRPAPDLSSTAGVCPAVWSRVPQTNRVLAHPSSKGV